jgi:GNAT superfamily N-acetyltransferase
MAVEIEVITRPQELEPFQDDIVAVYGEVFALPPYYERDLGVQGFAQRLPRHAHWPGFRCCIAREAGRVAGFTYGATLAPNQWWWQCVAPSMNRRQVARWLEDAFYFAELAVRPALRRRGIGGRLHDTLLAERPQRTAVLSMTPQARPALTLYHNRGWVVLLDNFFFPGANTPTYIMGLALRER